MDRREALRKMAMGTVVAAAATQVITRPAFADGGTVSYRPTGVPSTPTVTVSLTNFIRDLNITLTAPVGGSCRTTSGGPATPRIDTAYTATTSIAGVTSSFTTAQGTFVNGRSSISTVGSLTSGRFGGFWFTGDVVTVRFFIRYVCRGSKPGRAAWVCRSYETTVTVTGLGTVSASGLVTYPPGIAACDSPAPSAP